MDDEEILFPARPGDVEFGKLFLAFPWGIAGT
jgi:hypothetical protein